MLLELIPPKTLKKTTLRHLISPIQRGEVPIPGISYRQIGVRLWGEGAYERETIDGSQTQYTQLFRVEAGDIIVNKIWARNGSIAVVTDRLAGCFGSNEFPTYLINQEEMDIKWFHWFTKTPDLWRQCDLLSRGTSGKNRLKPERFLDVEIPLPHLSEQRRIVAQLDAVAEKLDAYRSEAKAHEAELRALLNKVFWQSVKDAPYRPMAKIAPLVRRPIEIDPDSSYPGLGVRSFGRGVFHKQNLVGAELTWQKLFRIEKGDIIFSNIKAWEGAFAVAGEADHGRVGSHRYLTCVPAQDIEGEFVWFFLQTLQGIEKVQEASPGTADRNRTLGTKALEAIQVPIPEPKKQQAFCALLHQVRKARQLRIEIEMELAKLLPAMLHSAFEKGEI